ncbi:MAG: HAD-IA family hydrolase [Dehalococcoidia bacterium]|nr:HAD-IA family hydrolase [Dehalococcoidia bacterium]
MIQAIFFDLYGTLAGFQPDRFQIQSQACAQFGIEVTPDGILRGYALADAFMSDQNAVQPVRTLSPGERNEFFAEYERRVLRGCGVDVSVRQAAEVWTAVREIPYEMARFDDVLPAMDLLKQQGFTLGLISNMNAPGNQLAEDMGLTPYLDLVVTSGEVGMEKPHPQIFHEALRRASVSAGDAAHIGDQLSSDIDGARNVGIHPVLLDRDRNHTGFSECPRIETLMELPMLMGGL